MSTKTPDVDSRSTELMSAEDISRTVARIAHQIIEKTQLEPGQKTPVVLLGIPSGGVPLAQRLTEKIREFTAPDVVACGSLDITLYRDDISRGPHRALKKTTIPDGGIDGRSVILVDDVLFSGRTIRAALDAIADIGRPTDIQLAVLVDRGHRRLPIRADYVGKNIPTSTSEDVMVYLADLDGRDCVTLTRPATTATESTT